MATREPKQEREAPPAYYIAEEPLFIGGQFGRAFNPGDRVPVEHVEHYGWADKVRRSDAPQNEPETDQATTERKGDA